MSHYRPRNIQRILQEHAKKTGSCDLKGKAKPMLLTTTLTDQSTVRVVQEKVTLQIRPHRNALKTTIRGDLGIT